MPIQLGRFEMPARLIRDDSTATGTYARFTAEPFEDGYGHTIGNTLRRVLLSSIEGASITAVKIDGAAHEFMAIPGVVEDVTDIVLNLKKVLLKMHDRGPRTVMLSVHKEGKVTAGDIKADQNLEVVNPDFLIATLDKKMKFEAELEIRVARGFCSAEENKKKDQPIGIIPIDSIFSPVKKVRYSVENTRVGQKTDYDKLVLDIWTDGRVTPDEALLHASAIIRHHLDVFVNYDKDTIEFEEAKQEVNEEQLRLKKLLNMSVNEIELSVRAANCLNNANIITVGQLAQKSEQEMLKYRNFGKKSLNEIKDKLQSLGLSLGMKFEPGIFEPNKDDSNGAIAAPVPSSAAKILA
jgi:DNA-directed RNA polymerase subunit alpha